MSPGSERAGASLVDVAEDAIRDWLRTGRRRPGDRLAPEQELSAQLGISRGTLRLALERLEQTGEIVRRQGSGTFVGRTDPTGLEEGLESLVPYSELARRQGVELGLASLEIGERRVGSGLGEVFGVDPDREATTFNRVLLVDGERGATMRDVVHPDFEIPTDARARRTLERCEMVLDLVLGAGIPISFATAHIRPRLVTRKERLGRELELRETVAAQELETRMCTAEGRVVQASVDIFLPGGLDLYVMRVLDDRPPVTPIVAGGAVSESGG
jgi:DNA-binding GntR family transcriptional regulator